MDRWMPAARPGMMPSRVNHGSQPALHDGLARELFEACPAPTLLVDEDVRLLMANGAALRMLGRNGDVALKSMQRSGEAFDCVHALAPGGCGRQPDCKECVVRNSVGQAFTTGPVRRARAFLRLRGERGQVDVCALVSASRIEVGGRRRVVLTLENVSDVQLKDEVMRAEQALREAHERAASLARFPEENPDPVLRVGADWTLDYANEAARTALSALQLHLSQPVPPELADAARRAIAEGGPVRAEIASGDRVFALTLCPAGTEVNVYATDVTDRKRAHVQLAAEKERLAVTLSSIGDAVIATDADGRVTMMNGVAEALTARNAAECIGLPIEDVFRIVNEQTRGPASDPVGRALREGIVVGLANHTALIARDGTEHPIADSAAPIRDAQGRTIGVVLVFRDQTRERQAEEALRDSERRVRLKLDSILSPEGDIGNLQLSDIVDGPALQALMDEFHRLARIPMAVIDNEGKVLVGVGWQKICTDFHRVHPETCRHCIESDTKLTAHVPPGEIRLYKCKNNMWDAATPIVVGGHHVGNVFTGQFFFDDEPLDYDFFRAQADRYGFDRAAYVAALEAVPRLGRPAVAAGMAFLLKFAGMLSNLSYSNIKLARSIAERDTLMASLRVSKARLEEADRRKDEFLAVLSHELRNPLAPIRNSIYLLERAPSGSDQASRAKEVLRRQTEHLTRLVDDLLDVVRISRGKIELRTDTIDLRDVVRKTADDLRSLFERSGVELRVEDVAEPLWADADATRIAQIVANLLHNSVKFTPSGGSVAVHLGAGDGLASLSVRDTGVGMDPQQVERMFEPFEQAHQGIARDKGGLGLGLALVRALVELHGGSVGARSAGLGLGTEVLVSLPLRATADAGPTESARRGDASSKVVLVIEDNPDAAESLSDILRLEGHNVHAARNGSSGLELARRLRPDAILCDIGLPDMDGLAVARAVRRDEALRSTRLIALSGYAQVEDRERSRDAGFDAHVAKPPGVDELLRVIADA
jgi:PAS domain S-box-containing protein